FLGGPGSCGVLVFNRKLDANRVPDEPGGGTVNWTNPWGGRSYVADVAAREDGGTPGFLQMIRAALALQLKERMDPRHIWEREHALTDMVLSSLQATEHVHVLAPHVKDRLGIISFYFDHLHFNLAVSLLNDHYGIQVRGGCSCAGTYGHYLLGIDAGTSGRITDQIDAGNLAEKPGWIRVSLHPTTTDEEAATIVRAVAEIAATGPELARDYVYDPLTNEFMHTSDASSIGTGRIVADVEHWRRWFSD
ncbi:MAG: aminotransferase class V-fold PLP-dependent enzyme, partial [Firmicutes bacterium]|nr:aminotransferase class V-fold PLP-dependent enzyme [Bacillota bacterium]